MIVYTYKTIEIDKDFKKHLFNLGREQWELVTISDGIAFFKKTEIAIELPTSWKGDKLHQRQE
jgi:hypothetical protein